MVLRDCLHRLSTVYDASVIGKVGKNGFYNFSIELCGQHRKKKNQKSPNTHQKNPKPGSLEMTYGFRATERKGESWAQSTRQAQ